MKKSDKETLTITLIIISIVYLVMLGLIAAFCTDMVASDYERYCEQHRYTRGDYIFPARPIACWLNEEIR